MKLSAFYLAALSIPSLLVSAWTPLTVAEWRSQSIYQLLTDRFARPDGSTAACSNLSGYCGGTWQGIVDQLDYIQGMGFTAIWISPIVLNAANGYHGYWAQDIYSVNPNFGTEDDLVALSAAVHARGMYLMVDIVTNHMGYVGDADSVDYSVFNPFDSSSYFHTPCDINYSDLSTIKVCWEATSTVSLADLRTEDSDVLDMFNSWIQSLISTYQIDGIRLDSSQQVDNAFLSSFQSAAGVYIAGEVFNGDPAYICPYQDYLTGVLNYPSYYWITQAFESTSGSISNLANGIQTLKSDCADTTLLGSFLENHDNERFPSITSDQSLTKNAIAFAMLADGIPMVYAGQEQGYTGSGDPANRAPIWTSGFSTSGIYYQFIAAINQIRNQAVDKDSGYVLWKADPVYSDGSTIVMRKGNTGSQIIGVFTNQGAGASSYTFTLASSATGFTAGLALIEVTACKAYTTDSSGNLAVAMSGGLPLIFYPTSQLTGSEICSSLTGSKSSTSTKAASTTAKPTSTTKTAVSMTTSCSKATSVAVTFNGLVTTTYGETVKLAGNNAALGNWATGSAITLSASQYTSSNPLWSVTVSFAPGTVIQYKFLKVESSGSVTWEADPNRSYTVPATCATTATVSDSWQS